MPMSACKTACITLDDEAQMTFYRALGFALEIVINEEQDAYPETVQTPLFGEELVNHVWAHIRGEAFFGGLPMGQAAFENSQAHLALLQVYQRVQTVKASAFAPK